MVVVMMLSQSLPMVDKAHVLVEVNAREHDMHEVTLQFPQVLFMRSHHKRKQHKRVGSCSLPNMSENRRKLEKAVKSKKVTF